MSAKTHAYNRRGKLAAMALLTAGVLLFFFAALTFAEACHDCSAADGDVCEVCAVIAAVSSLIRLAAIAAAVMLAVMLSSRAPRAVSWRHITAVTPVALRVKLSN